MEAIKSALRNAEKFQPFEGVVSELKGALPWLWEPAFRVGPNEGYFADGHLFGARAGFPEHISAYNVVHEVSHAVEMTLLSSRVWKRRLKRDNYEMRIKSFQDVMGQRCYEPQTMQSTERECRVGGIQKRILEAGGYDTRNFANRYVLVLRHMQDSYFGGRSPTNTPDPKNYTPEQHDWINLRLKLVQEAYGQFDLADIQGRWKQVMDWLAKQD